MRQIGTETDIWWRAVEAPTPSPALKARTTVARRPLIRARRRRSRTLTRTTTLLLLATAALVALPLVVIGLAAGSRSPLVGKLERVAEAAGFGLRQIAVTGQRYTADGDIFDALDLTAARTLLSFDSRAAKARIEQLPWIDRASIERVFPDGVNVQVVERQAFAVWRLGAQHYLIDKSGRRLGVVPASAMPALPRIAGEGAELGAAALLGRLAQYPALARRLDVAVRIGERRWTLLLTGGGAIHLPAEGEADALERAAALAAAGFMPAGELDLRVAGRTLLQAGNDNPARAPGVRAGRI